MIVKRIIFDLFLLGTIFYAPWWLPAIIAIFGAFYFHSYYEIMGAGILLDILYATGESSLPFFNVLGFLFGTVSFLIIERIKCELR